jgi:hypothetical protein
VLTVDQKVVLKETGQVWELEASVVDPAQPVRVMLTWTDAPGHGLGGSTPAWNNDLDLEVVIGGATYRGNAFDEVTGWSVAGGPADPMNNTEGVLLPPGMSGTILLRVLAANLDSDGVPGDGSPVDQDFAVACSNCVRDALIFADGFESGSSQAWD